MMHWTKGKCELCEFWVREVPIGDGVACRGECFVAPIPAPTYDRHTCGQFKKAGRRVKALRRVRAKAVAARKMKDQKFAEEQAAEIEHKRTRFMPKGKVR